MIWIVSLRFVSARQICPVSVEQPIKLKDVWHRGMIDNWSEKLVLVKRKKNYQSNA